MVQKYEQERLKMTFKIAIASAAITVASTVSAFAGCAFHEQDQAMSCSEGSAYDPETKTCVPVTTG